jgi:hypothetical protein
MESGEMNSIPVRSVNDSAIDERNKRLEREVQLEVNPLAIVGDTTAEVLQISARTLGVTGVVAVGAIFYGLYPRFARYRHWNIKKYTRRQVEFRQYWFGTANIPKVINPNESRTGWYNLVWVCFWAKMFRWATEMPEFPMM